MTGAEYERRGMSANERGDRVTPYNADPVHIYLSEIGKIPLLTAEQEVELAQTIELGRQASARLEDEDAASNLSPAEQMIMQQQAEIGADAMEAMIKANLRLVVSVAKRYSRQGVNLLDLVQDGNLGLMRAVERFDWRRGFRFSTYATWWIRQSITREIIETGSMVRIPVRKKEDVTKLYRKMRELEQKGEQPTSHALSIALGMKEQDVIDLQHVAYLETIVSLDQPVGQEGEGALIDFQIDHMNMQATDVVESEQFMEDFIERARQAGLSDRQLQVVLKRALLNMTLEEIGQELKVTRERVRQIEAKAIRKLRIHYDLDELKFRER